LKGKRNLGQEKEKEELGEKDGDTFTGELYIIIIKMKDSKAKKDFFFLLFLKINKNVYII
jgi:hypothetical protein